MRPWALAVALLIVGACDRRTSGPEETLTSFINYKLRPKQDRKAVLGMTTGTMHALVLGLSDEQFAKDAMAERQHNVKFKIDSKICQEESTCFLTYTVSYSSESNGKALYRMASKKVAELKRVESNWKLADITEVKSEYEGQEALEMGKLNP